MATPRTGRPRGRPKKPLPPAGAKPDLPERAWACLYIELSYGGIGEASLGKIQRHLLKGHNVRLGRESIRRWRLKPIYRRAYVWLIEEFREQLESSYAQLIRHDDDLGKAVEMIARERLHRWIVDVPGRWPGAVRSMVNGVIYTSPDAYADHLLESGYLPVELQDEVRAELVA